MIDTILFDLDGTLLPFNQENFTSRYFDLISIRAKRFGYEKEPLVKAIWAGTKAMIKNDGSRINHDAFWESFSGFLGQEVLSLEDEFNDFYATDFNLAKSAMLYTPNHSGLFKSLRKRGFSAVLATNPLFPAVAVGSRLGWVGLEPSDFLHITTYENSRFGKPNLDYYRELLQKIGREAGNCLMVGNSVTEDMCAAQLGMEVYLINENVENPGNIPLTAFPNGSFARFETYISTLPDPK